MKTLVEFKSVVEVVEEEKQDYSKFDLLVRAGLANKAQMLRIHRILDKMHEEKPVFTNADRMILQNLFNKMVDLISNNKQIFAQARRAVKEEVIVEAHDQKDPPYLLLLKRKAIRIYPDGTKVALYHNNQLNKYFSVPYGPDVDATIQAEEVELDEAVMDQLHNIVAGKSAKAVKFANGKTRKVDQYTASALTQVHGALNDDNKNKYADMVHKSPEHFAKASDFAFKRVK